MTAVIGALREKLSEFDGKATTFLGEAEAAFSARQGYMDALIALLSDRQGHLASGASWLLKSQAERGGDLTPNQVNALVQRLPQIEDWSTQLHICQAIGLLGRLDEVSGDAVGDLAEWLTALLDHDRAFLRAWSLDALGALAKLHAEHATVFNVALDTAQGDDAASVRARARHLLPL